jgi:Cu/Ag efflux protein CusF
LTKVDAAAKEITLKGGDNKEMVFTWNEQTKISGVEGPQGLAGAKTGSNLKVMYRENRGANLATQIEVGK